MAGAITITDVGNSTAYDFPGVAVEDFDQPAAVSEAQLAGDGVLAIGQADPVTGRTSRPPKWSLHLPALPDDDALALNSRDARSLCLGWRGSLTQLKLSGPEMGGMSEEILRREISGAYEDLRFWSEYGWWASGVVISVDGVVQSSGITRTVGRGYVVFDAPVSGSAVVTATGSREPVGRLTEVKAIPLNGYFPVLYDVHAVLREDAPA